jgi:murein DD-endopeptidase MepM/ murein hydrolase activator NlpD
VRYAYDFIGLDPEEQGWRVHRRSLLQSLLFGVRLQDFFGWGRPIFAASAGVVVQAQDGWPERDPVHPLRDTWLRFKNARAANSGQVRDFRTLTGNAIIVETPVGYALYAHAQTGSIQVRVGDSVLPGQHLANVGHSGNSTAPHLHFQLMDDLDPWKAQGLLCCFREYEVYRQGSWQRMENGIPKAGERIRKV